MTTVQFYLLYVTINVPMKMSTVQNYLIHTTLAYEAKVPYDETIGTSILSLAELYNNPSS